MSKKNFDDYIKDRAKILDDLFDNIAPDDEKYIFTIFNNKKDEELLEMYSFEDLELMLSKLLSFKPSSPSITKEKIIRAIRQYIHTMEQVQASDLRVQ